MLLQPSETPIYPVRIPLVGRESILDMIRQVIESPRKAALYLVGEGGTGKTRLLEETCAKYGKAPGFICPKIIDLYHQNLHTSDGVQYYLATELSSETDLFKKYILLHDEYLRKEGETSQSALRAMEKKRDKEFLSAYSAYARDIRIVLLIDTMELVQYDNDEVQKICQIPELSLDVKTWLTRRLPQLPNTAVVLAGRKQEVIQHFIEKGFINAGWDFKKIPLYELMVEEAAQFIQKILAEWGRSIESPTIPAEWLYQITGRKPILLALTLQYAYNQGETNVAKGLEILAGELARVEEPAREEKLSNILISHIISQMSGRYGDAMHYMFLARKGMDDALLENITALDNATRQDFFAEMEANILFKKRDSKFFLHDELYDRYDMYYRDDTYNTQAYIRIANFYKEKIDKCANYRQKLDLRVPALYYELQGRTEIGYQEFLEWGAEARWLHFPAHDLQLRDEFLRIVNRYTSETGDFYNRIIAEQLDLEAVNRDFAVAWIERFVGEGNNKKAYEVGQFVQNHTAPAWKWDLVSDPVYKARLLKAMAEPAIYLGTTTEAEHMLEKGIGALIDFFPSKARLMPMRNRTLGELFNRLGYYFRQKGYFAKAIGLYRDAIRLFNEPSLAFLKAQTQTNLSYLLIETGEPKKAEILLRGAAQTWQNFGATYRAALTQNTLSLALNAMGLHLSAHEETAKALKTFTELREARGILMAKIADGKIYRKEGNLWKHERSLYSKEDCAKFLHKGERILTKAMKSLEKMEEIELAWELSNELGSLYCDWAWLDRAAGRDELAETHYQKSIEFQEKAKNLAIAEKLPFQRADSLDDLAQAHGDRAMFRLERKNWHAYEEDIQKARDYLSEATADIPQPYLAFKREQLDSHKSGAPFWLAIAKANMWRGVWAYRELKYASELTIREDSQEQIKVPYKYLIISLAFFKRYDEMNVQLDRAGAYLLELIQTSKSNYEWVDQQITEVEKDLDTNLDFIRDWLVDIM